MNIIPSVIGLGYVGLPIFLKLQQKFQTIGYDNDKSRIYNLNKKIDTNKEFTQKKLYLTNGSYFTSKLDKLKKSNFYIVAVPTPVSKNNIPDLDNLRDSCILISKVLKKK